MVRRRCLQIVAARLGKIEAFLCDARTHQVTAGVLLICLAKSVAKKPCARLKATKPQLAAQYILGDFVCRRHSRHDELEC